MVCRECDSPVVYKLDCGHVEINTTNQLRRYLFANARILKLMKESTVEKMKKVRWKKMNSQTYDFVDEESKEGM